MTRTRITTNGLADSSVTYAKMQNVAADRLLGRAGTAGVVQEIVCTSAGRALIDDADAAAQRATLGLGAIIDVGGNVGIGTASPTTRLDVSAVSSTASGIWAGGTDFMRLLAGAGSAFSEQAISFQEAGSNVGAKIGVKNQGNGAYDILFATRDNSSLTSAMGERMRITAPGNVGIGTAAPARPLHVNSTGFFAARITSTDPVATVVELHHAAGTWELSVNGTTGTTGTAGTFYIWQQGGGPRFVISPTGNVGIGTTTPATNLHVVDATSPDIRLSGAGPSLDVLTTTTAGVVGTSTDHPLVLRANGVDRWRMQSDGALSTTAVGDTNNTLRPAGHVRAWARWTGTLTGTNSPVRSFNVTSVTRSSLGLYLVNLASALSSDNGVAVASAVSSTTLTDLGQFNNMANAVVINSTTVRVASADASNVFQDNAIMSVIVCDL